jgi:hypothetical protein
MKRVILVPVTETRLDESPKAARRSRDDWIQACCVSGYCGMPHDGNCSESCDSQVAVKVGVAPECPYG